MVEFVVVDVVVGAVVVIVVVTTASVVVVVVVQSNSSDSSLHWTVPSQRWLTGMQKPSLQENSSNSSQKFSTSEKSHRDVLMSPLKWTKF